MVSLNKTTKLKVKSVKEEVSVARKLIYNLKYKCIIIEPASVGNQDIRKRERKVCCVATCL